MKKSTVWISALAMSMALGAGAIAQPNGWHDGRRDGPGFDHRGPGGYGPPGHYDRDRRGPGAGPNHSFYRGERLPYEYRSNTYVVNNWRGHRLSPPPRGYHWVQTGADYVLVAIATGIIAQVLLSQ